MSLDCIRRQLISVAPWATVLACAGMAVTDVTLAVLTPDYDAVSETSSQLMSPDARYSALARVVLGLYAVLLVPFALALQSRLQHGSRSMRAGRVLVVAGMWIHIVASAIGALALNDSDDRVIGSVSANEVHDMAAMIMFIGAFAVIVGAITALRSSQIASQGTLYLVLAIFLVVGPLFALELWTETNGILERVLAGAFMVWMSVTALSWRGDRSTASR